MVPLEVPAPSLRPPRGESGRVDHLFWEKEGWLAAELGVELPALCGVWIAPPDVDDIHTVQIWKTPSGHRDIDRWTRDCGNCLRVLTAKYRRRGAIS